VNTLDWFVCETGIDSGDVIASPQGWW